MRIRQHSKTPELFEAGAIEIKFYKKKIQTKKTNQVAQESQTPNWAAKSCM